MLTTDPLHEIRLAIQCALVALDVPGSDAFHQAIVDRAIDNLPDWVRDIVEGQPQPTRTD
jgi:hypothetical protein